MSAHNIQNLPFVTSPALDSLVKTIVHAGGKPLFVGGAVRDYVLGMVPKDVDIEVYGLSFARLEELLSKHFLVRPVGKSFGILLVVIDIDGQKQSFDVALPRKENKIGTGHKAFKVEIDCNLSFEDASLRRDFTINSMAYDPINKVILDPHGGLEDLSQGVLRHVSEAFSEDPLRVFRAAQFCARFNLSLNKDTINLCHKLKEELSSLSKERIYGEIKKLLLSPKPSLGLMVLKETEALDLFPELKSLINCPQEYEWHPEGDVWVHTLMAMDEARELLLFEGLTHEEELIIMAGVLCHDLGKPLTTKEEDGRIKSKGHEEAGVEPTETLLTSFGFGPNFIADVVPLVKDHLKPHQLYKKRDEVTDGAIRRLAKRVNIGRLLFVAKADFCGRTTAEALLKEDPSFDWLKEKAQKLSVEKEGPRPILMGRHLLPLGVKPGKEMGNLLHIAMEAQLDGLFDDLEEAIDYVKKYIKLS